MKHFIPTFALLISSLFAPVAANGITACGGTLSAALTVQYY